MHPRELAISDFTYDLPEGRIAQQPLAQRDASKLLVYRDGEIADRRSRDLAEELPANALLVLNDTRVVNARLNFHRITGGAVEVLCLGPADERPIEEAFEDKRTSEWNCFIGNARRWKEGELVHLRANGVLMAAERLAAERVRFAWSPEDLSFAAVLETVGHVPLPPYMKRADAEVDKERYNTVFAQHDGSVAAPTASLHLTAGLLQRMGEKGIRIARTTLHVGAGTFLPVKSDRMLGHTMHHEQVRVPLDALLALQAQLGHGAIVPVGTTALRTIESIYWHGRKLLHGADAGEVNVTQWEPYETTAGSLPTGQEALQAVIEQVRAKGTGRLVGRTRLLIAPGYRFRFADGLVTNFHQPQSTLLLLVAAFIGPDWQRLYDHALSHDYRFLSYGDASLLWRSVA